MALNLLGSFKATLQGAFQKIFKFGTNKKEEVRGTRNVELVSRANVPLLSENTFVKVDATFASAVFLNARHDEGYTPVPLITDGLYFFLVAEATGSDLTTYDGHNDDPSSNTYYQKFADQSPENNGVVNFYDFSNFFDIRPNSEDFGVIENNNYGVTYFKFNNKKRVTIPTNSHLDFASTDPVTHIMWLRNVNVSDSEYIYQNGSNNFVIKRDSSNGHLEVRVPNSMTGTNKPRIYNYFNDSFPINTSEWHMLAVRIAAKSGADKSIDIEVIGKTQQDWNWSDDPYYFDFIDTQTGYEFATAGNSSYYGIAGSSDNASSFEGSIVLTYSRSLSDNEINQVYQHFAPSHGLVAGIQ